MARAERHLAETTVPVRLYLRPPVFHAPGAALRLLESSPWAISEKVPTATILRLNWRGVKVWFTGTLT
jgi:hypothetical protein